MYNLCIFEDTKHRQFLPLTHLRAVYELPCGLGTLLTKAVQYIPHENVILHTRTILKDTLKHRHINVLINQFTLAGSCLFLNGRALINHTFWDHVELLEGKNYLYLNEEEEVVMAYLSGSHLETMRNLLEKGAVNSEDIIHAFRLHVLVKKIPVICINYPWELIQYHANALEQDFLRYAGGQIKGDINPYVFLKNESQIYVEKNTIIEAFSVLDASEGPIYIGQHVHVAPHSYIKGPVMVADHSHILGARIQGSYVGPSCKIGGEVSMSMFIGHSNKAHEGFIGHACIGEWVNLGALTTNSNLKNNYQEINMVINGHVCHTNSQFMGALIGDHTKTGIGTLFNTGMVIGVGCNLWGGTLFSQSIIPSFSWGTPQGLTIHRIDKMIETAEASMYRRHIMLSEADRILLQNVFDATKLERKDF